MKYKHLTIDEIIMIESYFLQDVKTSEIAKRMRHEVQPIYNVVNQFKLSAAAIEYWNQYKENKKMW